MQEPSQFVADPEEGRKWSLASFSIRKNVFFGSAENFPSMANFHLQALYSNNKKYLSYRTWKWRKQTLGPLLHELATLLICLTARWAHLLLRKSILIIAGNTNKVVTRLKKTRIAACNENTRRAGIGMMVADKKAATLHRLVSNTLRPPFFRIIPVCSCNTNLMLEAICTHIRATNDERVWNLHPNASLLKTAERTHSLEGTCLQRQALDQDTALSATRKYDRQSAKWLQSFKLTVRETTYLCGWRIECDTKHSAKSQSCCIRYGY